MKTSKALDVHPSLENLLEVSRTRVLKASLLRNAFPLPSENNPLYLNLEGGTLLSSNAYYPQRTLFISTALGASRLAILSFYYAFLSDNKLKLNRRLFSLVLRAEKPKTF